MKKEIQEQNISSQLKYLKLHTNKEPSGNQSSEKGPLSEYCNGL